MDSDRPYHEKDMGKDGQPEQHESKPGNRISMGWGGKAAGEMVTKLAWAGWNALTSHRTAEKVRKGLCTYCSGLVIAKRIVCIITIPLPSLFHHYLPTRK